ncbi:flagellar biosynthetic protein FliR [Alkalibacillus filiformis]|uniref:Flagellar biosynthetic protein FliR n=1 Tax=Alkalibacillus filiformis TaxID=200990 RepID=A0ABU0DQN4_9BACI|nr:flagellar biosynthetic protein FliR [Alkalibacillus filiformis]MDQ0350636.1 flagellar biosynthetic protein FliR [Alkalibacillus filiformis]
MLELLDFTRLPAFFLVLARLAGFFFLVPLFSYHTIPMMHRVGFVFVLSWIMYLSLDVPAMLFDGQYVLLLLKEVTIGILIALIAYLILAGVQIAGGFIDFQMGFAIANVVDPQTGVQSPIIGQYYYIFALLLLVATNAHHLLIDGIFYSYQFIGFQDMIPIHNEAFPEFIIMTMSGMFLLAFQMAIPIVGTLFLVDVALGMIARTVPQMNVFVVGLPLKISVSFVVILISFSFFGLLISELFNYMFQTMRQLLEIMGGA